MVFGTYHGMGVMKGLCLQKPKDFQGEKRFQGGISVLKRCTLCQEVNCYRKDINVLFKPFSRVHEKDMESPIVPSNESDLQHHHVQMLQEPIPETSTRDLFKTICLGLAIAVGQFAVLIFLLGWAVHR